jgi:hypothetical protein
VKLDLVKIIHLLQRHCGLPKPSASFIACKPNKRLKREKKKRKYHEKRENKDKIWLKGVQSSLPVL